MGSVNGYIILPPPCKPQLPFHPLKYYTAFSLEKYYTWQKPTVPTGPRKTPQKMWERFMLTWRILVGSHLQQAVQKRIMTNVLKLTALQRRQGTDLEILLSHLGCDLFRLYPWSAQLQGTLQELPVFKNGTMCKQFESLEGLLYFYFSHVPMSLPTRDLLWQRGICQEGVHFLSGRALSFFSWL